MIEDAFGNRRGRFHRRIILPLGVVLRLLLLRDLASVFSRLSTLRGLFRFRLLAAFGQFVHQVLKFLHRPRSDQPADQPRRQTFPDIFCLPLMSLLSHDSTLLVSVRRTPQAIRRNSITRSIEQCHEP